MQAGMDLEPDVAIRQNTVFVHQLCKHVKSIA